jgi:uncharacterized protein YlxP (DUF503 family)
VAVAEVEHHKLHARATLAVVTVAESDYRCREVLEQVLRYTWQPGPAQLTHHEMEWLH